MMTGRACNNALMVPRAATCRGIASVEFAVSIGVLLLMMLGTVEIARAYFSYNTLVKSVRSGSRYLSDIAMNGTTGVVDLTAAKVGPARNLIVYGNLDGTGTPLLDGFAVGDISVTSSTPGGTFTPYVRVLASYDYAPMLGSFSRFGFGSNVDLTFTMTADSSMRALN